MHHLPAVSLLPASVPLLEALTSDPGRFGDLIGSPVPYGWPEFPEAIPFSIAQLQQLDDADRPWSMHFFIDEHTGRLVGSGGFAAPPADRTVEIGYEIAPAFRRRGFATAAAGALVARAVESGRVDHVVAHTLPGPNPSTGVLRALAFEHVATQDDPHEGTVWEWRWTRPGGPADHVPAS